MSMGHVSRRLGWGIIGALMVALLAALAGIAYGGTLDPPANVSTTTSTQANLIYQPSNCAGFPITIATSGTYALAQDITGCPGVAGIVINAPDVTLDLDGFLLKGQGTTGAASIGVSILAVPGAVVENGSITNWTGGGVNGIGINAAARHLLIQDNSQTSPVTANAGLRLTGVQSVVEDVIADHNAGSGIYVAQQAAVRGCTATANGNAGIFFANSGVIDGCEVANNALEGIYVQGQGSLIENNNVHNNGSNGIHAHASRVRIEHNNVGSNTGHGIWVHFGESDVSDNTSIGNTQDGYFIEGGGSRVIGNHSAGNLGGGFTVGAASAEPNVIVNNTSSDGPCSVDPFNIDPSNETGVITGAQNSTGSPWNNIGQICVG